MAAIIVPLLAAGLIFGLLATLLLTRKKAQPWPPAGWVSGESGRASVRAYALELCDKLDRAPFGPALAGQVWDRLAKYPVGEGLIHEFHRDFCGHGLIRTKAGVKLCDIQDGHAPGPAIAEWPSREAFVAFFAGQSDFSCSGWDETSPVFATQDEWYRNNQRLTRAKLLRFLNGPTPG